MTMMAEHVLPESPTIPLAIAAQELDVPRQRLWEMVYAGQVPAIKVGQLWFIETKDLDHLRKNIPRREVGPRGLRQQQAALDLLATIADNPGCTVQDLAEIHELPRRTALGRVQILARQGFIERTRSNLSRSPALIHMTADGRKALERQ